MENRKAKLIGQIDKVLADNKLVEEQRQVLRAFDRFNELEAQCRLSTRYSYLRTLHELGVCLQKPYNKMKREELQMYVADQKRHHRLHACMHAVLGLCFSLLTREQVSRLTAVFALKSLRHG